MGQHRALARRGAAVVGSGRPARIYAPVVRRLLRIRLELLDKIERMNLLEPAGAYIHCTAGLAGELPERDSRRPRHAAQHLGARRGADVRLGFPRHARRI